MSENPVYLQLQQNSMIQELYRQTQVREIWKSGQIFPFKALVMYIFI